MSRIHISEVGPRDGLQSIKRVMPLEAKKAWIAAEAATGVPEIEVGSLVPPSLLLRVLCSCIHSHPAFRVFVLAALAIDPEHVGCQHLKALLKEGPAYGTRLALTQFAIVSFLNVLFDYTNALRSSLFAVCGSKSPVS